MSSSDTHKSVLLKESIDSLVIQPTDICIDATVGLGGHSLTIVEKLDKGKLIAIDFDSSAIQMAQAMLSNITMYIFINSNFREILPSLNEIGIERIDKVIADLGWGSHQILSGRGFSFKEDAPLDMCYSKEGKCHTNALEIVNTWN